MDECFGHIGAFEMNLYFVTFLDKKFRKSKSEKLIKL